MIATVRYALIACQPFVLEFLYLAVFLRYRPASCLSSSKVSTQERQNKGEGRSVEALLTRASSIYIYHSNNTVLMYSVPFIAV